MLEQLQRLMIDVVPLEELVAAQMLAKSVDARFKELKVDTPPWIQDKLRQLSIAIRQKTHDQRAREKHDLQRKLQGLMSKEEQRAEAEKRLKELDELDAELAKQD